MKRSLVLSLTVGLVASFGAVSTSAALAIEAEPTPDSHWLQPSPLMISAYQRSSSLSYAGDDLQLVELYNDGDVPLDVTQWTIRGSFKKSSTSAAEMATMNITPRTPGLLAPGSHAVVDAGAGVSNASYEMNAWSTPKPVGTLVSLSVIAPSEGIVVNDYTLKTTGSGATTQYTELWRRAPLTTPGYSATLSNFSASPMQLFDDGLYEVPLAPAVAVVEIYPYASDCTPFDMSVLCSDYVKLYNPTDATIDLNDFALRTDSSSANRTNSNTVLLSGQSIAPHGYLTIATSGDGGRLSLTNDGGYVWLEDRWGLARYDKTLAHYASAGTTKQGYAWAQKSDGVWEWTSTPRPDADNNFPVVLADQITSVIGECPAGKYRNPETNRCRTIEEAVNSLAVCPEGQYRNPETNRCKSTVSTVATLTPCGEGQERNPATNRCRSIASAVAELLPCDEGYERNPATNRCRKIVGVSNITPSLTQPAEASASSNWLNSPYSIAAVVVVGGVGYTLYEWRSEIAAGYKKLVAKVGKQ